MEDSYISNIQEDDQILDSDSIEKIHQLETQIESLKLQLSESEKKNNFSKEKRFKNKA